MKTLLVLGGVLLALFLIGEIRIGGLAEYRDGGFFLKAKVALFWLDIYPATKEKTREPKKKKADSGKRERKGGKLTLLLELVPVIVAAVKDLLRKIRIDVLELHLTWAAEDPAAAAVGFGAANAAMGAIYVPLKNAFRIKKDDIRIDIDFDLKEPIVYGKAKLTITIGQVVMICVCYGIRALVVWTKRHKKEQDKKVMKEARSHE